MHDMKLIVLATLLVSPLAFAQSEPETRSDWSYRVVKLQYATAEELAPVLAAIAPPGVKIVAYPPTNSLIIAGDPVIIGKGETEDANGGAN